VPDVETIFVWPPLTLTLSPQGGGERGLYTTAVPFPFNLEFACGVTGHNEVENALHIAFAPYRVNPRREFFKIEPAQAIAILKLLHTADATAEVAAEVAAEFNAEPTGEKQKDMELRSRAGE
jgi:hypothetical protein